MSSRQVRAKLHFCEAHDHQFVQIVDDHHDDRDGHDDSLLRDLGPLHVCEDCKEVHGVVGEELHHLHKLE